MKPSLLAKLEAMAERREEVARELGDASVIADNDRFRRLSQEYAQLGPLAESYTAHRDATRALGYSVKRVRLLAMVIALIATHARLPERLLDVIGVA